MNKFVKFVIIKQKIIVSDNLTDYNHAGHVASHPGMMATLKYFIFSNNNITLRLLLYLSGIH